MKNPTVFKCPQVIHSGKHTQQQFLLPQVPGKAGQDLSILNICLATV